MMEPPIGPRTGCAFYPPPLRPHLSVCMRAELTSPQWNILWAVQSTSSGGAVVYITYINKCPLQ